MRTNPTAAYFPGVPFFKLKLLVSSCAEGKNRFGSILNTSPRCWQYQDIFGGQNWEIWDISGVSFVLVTVRTILVLTSRQG